MRETPLRDVEVLPLAGNTFPTVIVGVAQDEAGFAVQTTPEGLAWLFTAV
jgi:hypothetical protein